MTSSKTVATKLATRFKRSSVILLAAIGVLAGLSIFARNDFAWGRVAPAALADADQNVARYGPASVGAPCAVDGTMSKDPRGEVLMCWRLVWAKP